jgi:putative two-component system response regulator
VLRVGYSAAVIARQLGLDEDFIGWIELAAQLHDVGKLSIPDRILHKPGKLNDEERKIIETHCENADLIFFGKNSVSRQAVITSPLLKMAARIASSHHERWDGGGYPRKLAGDQIPFEGRITAVADVFDALSSKRCYKDAFSFEDCISILEKERGKHFDPQVLDAFLSAKDEIRKVMCHWQDARRDEGQSQS